MTLPAGAPRVTVTVPAWGDFEPLDPGTEADRVDRWAVPVSIGIGPVEQAGKMTLSLPIDL
jgi:hypothetical protein